MMLFTDSNIDSDEKLKFDALAPGWWDPRGQFKTLHAINPIRMQYIEQNISLKDKNILDIGCGGGLLTEALARRGAAVTGLDISDASLTIARHHCKQSNLEINYINSTVEDFAGTNTRKFDVITCMEMLEHVPDPVSVIKSCAELIKPGGDVFFSTLNRNLPSYILAVIFAEYLLKLLPAGTHDYSRFIRPSELFSWCQQYGLQVTDISGISYLPFINKFSLNNKPVVNYLLHANYGR